MYTVQRRIDILAEGRIPISFFSLDDAKHPPQFYSPVRDSNSIVVRSFSDYRACTKSQVDSSAGSCKGDIAFAWEVRDKKNFLVASDIIRFDRRKTDAKTIDRSKDFGDYYTIQTLNLDSNKSYLISAEIAGVESHSQLRQDVGISVSDFETIGISMEESLLPGLLYFYAGFLVAHLIALIAVYFRTRRKLER